MDFNALDTIATIGKNLKTLKQEVEQDHDINHNNIYIEEINGLKSKLNELLNIVNLKRSTTLLLSLNEFDIDGLYYAFIDYITLHNITLKVYSEVNDDNIYYHLIECKYLNIK